MMTPIKDKQGQSLSLSAVQKKVKNRLFSYFLDLELFLLWIVGYIPVHLARRIIYSLCGLSMGRKSTIHMGARFYDPKNISIGEGTIIGDHAFLDGRDKLTIGSHTSLASQVMIYNSEHDIHDPYFMAINGSVHIGDYVFIGPRAIILPGVTIASGAIVAAGAVVTKDVGEKQIVGGVPAKQIGVRSVDQLNYKLGRFRLFQ